VIKHVGRHPGVRDRTIFVGNPEDIAPRGFDPLSGAPAGVEVSAFVPNLDCHLLARRLLLAWAGAKAGKIRRLGKVTSKASF
jgi:hypothetical protein